MNNRRTYTCENGKCSRKMRLTEQDYTTRARGGLLVYCAECVQAGEPARRLIGNTVRTVKPKPRRQPRTTPRAAAPSPGRPPDDDAPAPERTPAPATPGANGVLGISLAPAERDLYGATVTAREQVTGAMMTVSRRGPVVPAVRAICGTLDALAGDWKVVTISTPATIFRDLQGIRDGDGGAVKSLERDILGRAGRLDLLERRTVAVLPSAGSVERIA